MSKCKKQRWIQRLVSSSKGTTLVEVLVSLALLLSVLLPASIFLGYIANYPDNRNKVIALSRAQTSMEQLLKEGKFIKMKDISKQPLICLVRR